MYAEAILNTTCHQPACRCSIHNTQKTPSDNITFLSVKGNVADVEFRIFKTKDKSARQVYLNTRLSTQTLLLSECLRLVPALATTRVLGTSAGLAREDFAMRAGFLGHGSDLVHAV